MRKTQWLEFGVTDIYSGKTVKDILTGPMGISGRMIQKLTRNKGILLNGRTAFLKRPVKAGDKIKVNILWEEEPILEAEPMELQIVFEDNYLLVLNKPAGLAVHPTRPGQKGTLANGVAWHLAEQSNATRVRPVHRLDRDTSGVIVFAKNQYTHQFLDTQLRNREMKREYLGVVSGSLPEDKITVNAPIGRDPRHPTRRQVSSIGEPAVTHIEVIERLSQATVVRLNLESGRTHQLRVHLSHLGFPFWGDRLYGGKAGLISRQALHASSLSLLHPMGARTLKFEAPLPEDLNSLLKELRGS